MHNYLSRNYHLSLIFLVSMNAIPHFEDHPLVASILGLVCVSWRLLYEYQKVALPNIIVKTVLVALSFFIVFRYYGTFKGAESATALLIAGVFLKLIDRVSYRDAMVVLFLNFLLLMAKFLVSQSLNMTILGVVNLILITSMLVQLHHGQKLDVHLGSLFKVGLKLLLQTSPLLILLFIVFPRFSTGFIQLSQPNQASTGFSPKLEPGSVSRLVATDEVAFRVEFDSYLQPKDLYWRGAVLTEQKGMVWEPDANERKEVIYNKPKLEETFQQSIILEPSFGEWLFVLDSPVWVKMRDKIRQYQSYHSQYNTFSIKRNNGQKLSYQAYSELRPVKQKKIKFEKFLQISAEEDEKLQTLVTAAKENGHDAKAIRDFYLDYFKKNLSYTLTPPLLKTGSVSEFLFETRQGFCEHLAGSFAYLMRASGVPSRVVVGFQGGEKNDWGRHYTIKSKDAHAWAEFWDDTGQRWQRVDPTQSVAPLRIQLGGTMFHSLSPEELQAQLSQEEYQKRLRASWYFRVFGKAQLAFDLASLKWNQFLLDFDSAGQKAFLEKWGLSQLKKKHLGGLSLLILCLFFLINYYFKNRRKDVELKSRRFYREICHKFSEKGVSRPFHWGPRRYLEFCSQRWPLLAEDLERFRHVYEQISYKKEKEDPGPLEELQTLRSKILSDIKDIDDKNVA